LSPWPEFIGQALRNGYKNILLTNVIVAGFAEECTAIEVVAVILQPPATCRPDFLVEFVAPA
jgi:hypothetical protein